MRKCRECSLYYAWPREPDKGKCFLFDSVPTILKRVYGAPVKAEDPCMYGLYISEKEGVELTRERVAEIVNRVPGHFYKKVKPISIRVDSLKGWLEEKQSG